MENEKKSREIDLMDYWRVVLKRKWILVTFAGALIFFTAIFTLTKTPLYKSTATLLFEEESSKILSIEETFGYQSRVVQDMRSFNTQLKLLKSKSLSERVARKLNLLARLGFGADKESKPSLISGIKYIATLKWISAREKQKENRSSSALPSNPYSEVSNFLMNNLEVNPIGDTKLVEVSFIFPSPVLASEIVNTLAEEFINFSIEKRYATTQQASSFLTEQIANLRDDLAAKERELQRYGQEKDLVFLTDTESAAVNQFARLNEAYNQARIERINVEAEYRELRNLEGDVLPQYISDPAIQQLRMEYARLRAEYREKSNLYKPDYPEMVRLKSRMDSLKDEINKAADVAQSKYQSALNKEGTYRNLLEKQRGDMAKMSNNAILYNSIKIEVESKRKQLNDLVNLQNQTQLSAQLKGLNASNVSIIDRAEIPKSPISPNKKKNLLMAFLIGLFGGVGLCFLFEYLDDSVKGPEDVEKLTGLPSLGVITYLPPEGTKREKAYSRYMRKRYSYGGQHTETEHTLPEIKEIELVNHFHPDLPLSEDYRTIRTSILLSHAENPPKTILVSSPLTQEGKTATVVNMAVSFSQLQERVLVVETDLRKPRLHRIFKIRNIGGLTGFLIGKVSLKESIQKTFVDNIWLLPSGPLPPNPAELLNSKKMKDMAQELGEVFDIVFFDSAPVLAVIDPVIISSIVGGTILVIRGGKTRRKPFVGAVEELKRARANLIGIVFNGADLGKEGSYYSKYFRYYSYSSYGKEDQEVETKTES